MKSHAGLISGNGFVLDKKIKTLVAHPGTQYSFYLAEQLERLGILYELHTGYGLTEGTARYKLLSTFSATGGYERQLNNRLVRGIPTEKLHTYPLLEFTAFLKQATGWGNDARLAIRNRKFQQKIPAASLAGADVIIGFDTSADILIQRAKLENKPFILDRSIGTMRAYQQISNRIKLTHPDWKDLVASGTALDLDREKYEHDNADLIVVPGRFVARTVMAAGIPETRIRINPFGVNTHLFSPAEQRTAEKKIFLFVGALMARKGVFDLIRSWHSINTREAELWIAGTGRLPHAVVSNLPASVKLLGPVAQSRLPALLRQADVFVFPSYFEGLARVLLEAAACGLPIIATPESGAEEIIVEGENGLFTEAGNIEQLAEKIDLLCRDDGLLENLKSHAIKKHNNWDQQAYGKRWLDITTTFMSSYRNQYH